MKVYIVVGILAAVFCAVGEAVVDRPCTLSSECDDGECCQIVNIIVASRKRLAPLRNPAEQQGTCQRYTQQGRGCQSFDVMNGFCGCEPGLTCRSFFMGTASPLLGTQGRRDMLPGYVSRCAP